VPSVTASTHILLMNRSLFTGRPFFPLVTGVSVHISFCSPAVSFPTISSHLNPSVEDWLSNLRRFPRSCTQKCQQNGRQHTTPPPQLDKADKAKKTRTHILQCRSKALTLASLQKDSRQFPPPQTPKQTRREVADKLTACGSIGC